MSNRVTPAALSPAGAAFGLSAVLVALFMICALAQLAFPNFAASHAWVALFTTAPILSIRAWTDGIAFSLVFGAIAGVLFAVTYNAVVIGK